MKTMSDELDNQLQIAANAMSDFANGPAKQAGDIISQSFRVAGNEIATSLERAAKSGEFSIKKLITAILRELSQLALEKFVFNPLEGAISKMISGLPNILSSGSAIIGVGQSQKPAVTSSINSPINITINMPSGAGLNEARKSASQISAALARTINRGRGLL